MYDITALGEILIDFTPAGVSQQGNVCFERNPGGAPANVLACVSKFGGKTAFIGKVGNDMFGHYLAGVLEESGIEKSGLKFTDAANTTLAFVQLDDKGDRSFSFYRNPGADTTLEANEVNYDLIKHSKIFHFGSLSLTHEPAENATLAALKSAKESGCMISYDPNLRMALWKSREYACGKIKSVLDYADILKISEEELEFITDEKDLEKGTEIILNTYKTQVILVTLGHEGCYYRCGSKTGKVGTFNSLKAVDTTGAGDTFFGAFLYSILTRGIKELEKMDTETLEEIITFSNAAASLCVTKRGAIPSMPELKSVQELVKAGR